MLLLNYLHDMKPSAYRGVGKAEPVVLTDV